MEPTLEPVEPALPIFSDLSLHEDLLSALEKLNFQHTTAVQAATIPLVLAGKDLLVSAETGSGKTAAFLLPCLQKILSESAKKRGIEILILAPTRELAQQINVECQKFAEFTTLQTGLIIGSEDFRPQQILLRKKPTVVIATPGRLLEHVLAEPSYFHNLKVLILDEADRMLDMGFSPDVLAIAEQCNRHRQTLLFSATLTSAVIKVADAILVNPETVRIHHFRDNNHASISQQVVLCDDQQHKQQLLLWLLKNEVYHKALVFANTKVQAEALLSPLRSERLRTVVLHGDLEQSERNRVMELFRKGSISVMIATDLAARGLDIEQIQLVINFDMPRNANSYVHRIGRTGRAGEKGLAISLINSNEWNLMKGVERYLNQEFEARVIQELVGKYKGPKKLKKSGKAVATKKHAPEKKSPAPKIKVRDRDKKNIGKRRIPTAIEANEQQS